MQNENNAIELQDKEGSEHTQKNDFRNSVMNQFNKCIAEGGKERDRGGIRKRMINDIPVEIFVPNQYQIFTNEVKMLKIMLYPYIKQHEQFSGEFMNNFEDKLKEYNRKAKQTIQQINKRYSELSENKPIGGTSDKEQATGELGTAKQKVYDKLEVRIYNLNIELLGHLSMLLNKLNYFSEDD